MNRRILSRREFPGRTLLGSTTPFASPGAEGATGCISRWRQNPRNLPRTHKTKGSPPLRQKSVFFNSGELPISRYGHSLFNWKTGTRTACSDPCGISGRSVSPSTGPAIPPASSGHSGERCPRLRRRHRRWKIPSVGGRPLLESRPESIPDWRQRSASVDPPTYAAADW